MVEMALEGRLGPHIMASFPLERFHEAFALVRNRTVKGKIILTT
jgi:D-arabinose 1-dehydrogenase-like Zn-dependent alcohol dehydrogenase